MNAARDAQFLQLIDQAVELPEADLAVFLESACDDEEMRQEVRTALREDLGDFLEQPALVAMGLAEKDEEPEVVVVEAHRDVLGSIERIGPYRILEEIGGGGMGRVFLAEQREPIERRVALKLMRTSLLSPRALARFSAERQAMARLGHANVARIFDAGTTDDGHPFFAMEHVPGTTIVDYCDKHSLGIEERLRLFVDVCAGVQHAHQRGIIHRDLKPSNILVTETEEGMVPKIIDFGIAKALDQPLTDVTQLTSDKLVGTPAYMSPESFVEADAADLDTRTDVYALGVLLYELLSGALPFDVQSVGLVGFLQRLAAEDSPRPSVRLSSLEAEARTAAAERRRLGTAAHVRRLRGDLDWIVSKAIARSRDERYASVTQLATDVERHLRDEVILAGPPSVRYRLGKFVRRHRPGVAASAVAFLIAFAAGVGISVALVRAQRAEAEARAQAERAQTAEQHATLEARAARRVSDFLVELFESSAPDGSQGADVTARQLLERGSQRIQTQLGGEPLVQARLMATLGQVSEQLGLLDRAEELLAESLRLRRVELGEDHLEVATSRVALGELYRKQGRLDEAEAAIQTALDRLNDLADTDARPLTAALRSLAAVWTDRGNFARSEELQRQALSFATLAYGEESPEVGDILFGLGHSYLFRGQNRKAQNLFLKALAIQEDALGPHHPTVATTLSRLAATVWNDGDYEEARRLNERALAIYEQALGPEHPQVSRVLSNMGYDLFRQGGYEEARPLLERAVRIDKKIFSHDHPYAACRLTNLGLVYWKLGRFDEAESLFRKATAIRERVLAPGHPHRATSLWGLANVYRDEGRFAEAEPLYQEALTLRENALPPGDPELVDAQREYAVLLRRTGREEEAAALEARFQN